MMASSPSPRPQDADTCETPRFKVTLGVVPDYMYDGKGMRIDGVTDGKPAAKAGLKVGDVVVKLGDDGRERHDELHEGAGGVQERRCDDGDRAARREGDGEATSRSDGRDRGHRWRQLGHGPGEAAHGNAERVGWWVRRQETIEHIRKYGHNPDYISAAQFDVATAGDEQ